MIDTAADQPLHEPQAPDNLATPDPAADEETIHDIVPVAGLYQNYFLDYASYVILERAVPAIEDGCKPVQRRILHAMKEMDDGRFNKVANVIGQTMQYHPHGDASIGDAMVNLGQKDLLIETQGNWGDVRTGDGAAAPRYIEARLSKFALDVVFNPRTTTWQASYDGRKLEPVALPVKFPLLLAQGVDGIAVGLSTKIMPHNFRELCRASIDSLKGRPVQLLPDFPAGGLCDASNYQSGMRGGKLRLRATIEKTDKTLLTIRDIPYGTTTTSLMESIVKASEANKIKIKKVVDNTAALVEIQVQLPPGVSPDVTIDALYAFTDCEISISPNTCVIIGNKPRFVPVEEILHLSTAATRELLRRELEIRQADLEARWHAASLERIFIEKRIYRDIEECETWEAILATIEKGLRKYVREPGEKLKANDQRLELRQPMALPDDLARLTEIKIKRISRYDAAKADELLRQLETDLAEVADHLANLTRYAVAYFERLLKQYGGTRERKTELRSFETITAQKVAVANEKLYVNRADGFVGIGLKKDEYVCDCSSLDEIIAFKADGTFTVVKVADKTFVGKDIIHVEVFNRQDERRTYNLIYTDGQSGVAMAKRFAVTGITREKQYDLTKGTKGSKVIYLTSNPNAESEVVRIALHPSVTARHKEFDFDFAELGIKGKGAGGNIVTKYRLNGKQGVKQVRKGESTLGGRAVSFDDVTGRLNHEGHGRLLGLFNTDDTVLVVYRDGSYEQTTFDLANHYDVPQIAVLRQFDPETIITALHYDPDKKEHFVKRFRVETTSVGRRFPFISEEKGAKALIVTAQTEPLVKLTVQKEARGPKETLTLNLAEFTDAKGWKAQGRALNYFKVHDATLVSPEITADETAADAPAPAPKAKPAAKAPTAPRRPAAATERAAAETGPRGGGTPEGRRRAGGRRNRAGRAAPAGPAV